MDTHVTVGRAYQWFTCVCVWVYIYKGTGFLCYLSIVGPALLHKPALIQFYLSERGSTCLSSFFCGILILSIVRIGSPRESYSCYFYFYLFCKALRAAFCIRNVLFKESLLLWLLLWFLLILKVKKFSFHLPCTWLIYKRPGCTRW